MNESNKRWAEGDPRDDAHKCTQHTACDNPTHDGLLRYLREFRCVLVTQGVMRKVQEVGFFAFSPH